MKDTAPVTGVLFTLTVLTLNDHQMTDTDSVNCISLTLQNTLESDHVIQGSLIDPRFQT